MTRRERLLDLIDRRGLGAALLRRPANFAWYTGGADSRVDHVVPQGVADMIVTAAGDELVLTSTIEAPRFRGEQTPSLEVIEYPWFEDREAAVRSVVGDLAIGSDVGFGTDIGEEVAALRRVLDPDAVERLRSVGHDASLAMTDAAAAVEPGMTEFEAVAALQAACLTRGLSASVLLAAADERIALHRHPVPVGAVIKRRAMLVASAERGGLYANLTRIVEFEELDSEEARRVAACEEILARTRDEATRTGRTLAAAFGDICRFYADAGFPDEWKLHHQGGTCGYGSREIIASPATDWVIGPGQAFAWNPSITGAKTEETFVLTETGPEVVAAATVAVA